MEIFFFSVGLHVHIIPNRINSHSIHDLSFFWPFFRNRSDRVEGRAEIIASVLPTTAGTGLWRILGLDPADVQINEPGKIKDNQAETCFPLSLSLSLPLTLSLSHAHTHTHTRTHTHTHTNTIINKLLLNSLSLFI